MNFFEQQKQSKESTLESLEQIKKSIEELQKIEKSVEELKKIKKSIDNNINHISNLQTDLIQKFDNLKGKDLELSIKKSISEVEDVTKKAKLEIERTATNINSELKNLSRNINFQQIFFYLPITIFISVIIFISGIYFVNVRYIKNQTEELVNQNNELRRRVNSLYYLELKDKKFWYDTKNQKLFINDHKWIEDKIKKEKYSK